MTREISRRQFIQLSALSAAGIFLPWITTAPTSEAAGTTDVLRSAFTNEFAIFGAESALSAQEIATLFSNLNNEWTSNPPETSSIGSVYYTTEVIEPESAQSIATNTGYEGYTDFLQAHYDELSNMFAEAQLPISYQMRRLLYVDNLADVPSSWHTGWLDPQNGLRDSHGVDGLYVGYDNPPTDSAYWDEAKRIDRARLHEGGHSIAKLNDDYEHNAVAVLPDIPEHWQSYDIGKRNDGRSGLMATIETHFSTESVAVFARRLLAFDQEGQNLSMLPPHEELWADYEGYPNRFAQENIMSIGTEFEGAHVRIYRKAPNAQSAQENEQQRHPQLIGEKTTQAAFVEQTDMLELPIEATVNERGQFTLPNVFADIVNTDGRSIDFTQDTIFLRIEDAQGGLLGFRWMDSVDFSLATGAEKEYPNAIKYTMNVVTPEQAQQIGPEHFDWNIYFEPADGFQPGIREYPAELAHLVDLVSVRKIKKPQEVTATPTSTSTPSSTPTSTSTPPEHTATPTTPASTETPTVTPTATKIPVELPPTATGTPTPHHEVLIPSVQR